MLRIIKGVLACQLTLKVRITRLDPVVKIKLANSERPPAGLLTVWQLLG
jgi:hypothetical protein